MPDSLLVLNAGSSSLKFSVFRLDQAALPAVIAGQIEGIGTDPHFVARSQQGEVMADTRWPADSLDHAGALSHLMQFLDQHDDGLKLRAIGHRVVHGGVHHARPERVTDALLTALEQLVPLAPLHQPHNLRPIRLLAAQWPDLPQVACFDTAFHRSQPELAQWFAIPRELTEAGVRRYGFHGLSYEHIATHLGDVDPRAASGRTVVLHLGNGSSGCAIHAGRSVASTMGFTAVDGLMMGTRTGALDPGVVLYLIQQRGMDAAAVERLLYKESGLLGVSGLSSDMRTLLDSPTPEAAQAVALFAYRAQREVASLAAAMGGIDALVFTAGIGEHAAAVREAIASGLDWLGLDLDRDANRQSGSATRALHAKGSRTHCWVMPTDEEGMIARHTRQVLGL